MRKLAIVSIKGGVGKTTITCGLAFALKRLGRKVGICEVDITGASLYRALGLREPPSIRIQTGQELIIPSNVEGLEIFTIASCFGDGALMWRGGESEVIVDGERKILKGTGRYELIRQIIRDVKFSDDIDYLLYDLPPSSGDEVISLWDNLQDLYGVIIVTQPTYLSAGGLSKTLKMLYFKELPLLGVIINMDSVICPKCGEKFVPFIDTEEISLFIEIGSKRISLPILGRVPFSKDLERYFDEIALKIEKGRPKRLGETMTERAIKKMERAGLRILAPIIAGKKEILVRENG